jgi:hypothetical protein
MIGILTERAKPLCFDFVLRFTPSDLLQPDPSNPSKVCASGVGEAALEISLIGVGRFSGRMTLVPPTNLLIYVV